MHLSDSAYRDIEHNARSLCKWLGIENDTLLTWQVIPQRGATGDGEPIDHDKGATFAARPSEIARECERLCDRATYPNLYFAWGLFDPAHKRLLDNCTRVLALVMDCDACDWIEATDYQADLWDAGVDDSEVEPGDEQGLRAARVKAIKEHLWSLDDEEHSRHRRPAAVVERRVREAGGESVPRTRHGGCRTAPRGTFLPIRNRGKISRQRVVPDPALRGRLRGGTKCVG